MYFTAKVLLAPPAERAAFSDRQAYVCAELSNLAYFRFEGGDTLEQALKIAEQVFGNDARLQLLKTQLQPLLNASPSAADEGKAALAKILVQAGFALVETFNNKGTQAFLCTREIPVSATSNKRIAYLVYRGTQPTEFADIKSDISAALRPVELDGETVFMHSGYLDAFALVRDDVEFALAGLHHDQLIITGHSLGGALAAVTTRLLFPDANGACYTFGAPPVGAMEVQNGLKTPIYQIVNEIDIVPRLPNPWWATILKWGLHGLRVALKITTVYTIFVRNSWEKKLGNFIEGLTRYRHPGYVSYLEGEPDTARLRFNVSSFDQLGWWLRVVTKRGLRGFGVMAGDHSVELYVAKLKANAKGRQ
ncbi:MAG: hypothetical protein RIR00_122 [Pseudomonadota bacterium]|jgi:pimeloyl-ACP methyl ester carboxylesterase